MTPLLVTSLHKGAGRTAVCAGLARLLSRRQRSVFLCKPLRLTDGTEQQSDPDAAFFARLTGVPQPESWPLPISAAEKRQGLSPSIRQGIAASLSQAAEAREVIIEGPPATAADVQPLPLAADLAEALDARVLAIIRYAPGIRAEDVLPALETFGDRLVGAVVNGVTRYQSHTAASSLAPALEAGGIRVIGLLPETRCMLGITVGQLVGHLKGEFVMGMEKWDQLVDHVMIGGLVMNPGIDYFSRYERKAVIVRGDRPDIQMAALGTPTECLVLTGGHRPVQYIEHEAREEEIPLVTVEEDTLTTARSMETLFDGATVHHPDKADCFADLLESTVAPEALDTLLGTS